ncbi:hypothetical protein Lal_00001266 [Lupinus albus]|nr:hypothetical protein Lal_00001266 [Lupinus albus]
MYKPTGLNWFTDFQPVFTGSIAYAMTINTCTKFKVEKFNRVGNNEMWQRRVNDLLARQSLSKALREDELNELKENET